MGTKMEEGWVKWVVMVEQKMKSACFESQAGGGEGRSKSRRTREPRCPMTGRRRASWGESNQSIIDGEDAYPSRIAWVK